MVSDRVMRWLAIHFGERVEWNGPTVLNGYLGPAVKEGFLLAMGVGKACR